MISKKYRKIYFLNYFYTIRFKPAGGGVDRESPKTRHARFRETPGRRRRDLAVAIIGAAYAVFVRLCRSLTA